MRKAVESAVIIPFCSPVPSYARRPLGRLLHAMTCLALVVHRETEKALLVSDNADPARAVWCPRALLALDPCVRGDFIVATMPKRLAEQKGLWPRWVDTEGWLESRVIALADAEGRAARKRNQLRGGHIAGCRHLNQNDFA